MTKRSFGRAIVIAAALACSEPPPGPPGDTVSLIWRNDEVRGETIPVFDEMAVYNLEQETHIVSAVRKSDGVTLWKKTLPVALPDFDGHGLALAEGVLVVGDLDLFGLNPITGDILWQFVPSEGQYPGYSSLTAVGSVIFAASTSGHLYAVDAVTGTQRWAKQFNAETPTQVFNPTVAGGVVYAGFTYRPAIGPHQGGAVAIDTAGNLLWKTFTPRATASTHTEVTYGVAVTANEVVVGDNIGAYFLNKTTGAVQKSLTSTDFAETANADHRPVAAGDLVIIGTSLGNVVAFDATTHGRRWYRALGASVRSLAVDHSNVYLALLTGPFYILRWADGSVVWALDPGIGNAREDYLRAPSIDGDVLYLAGTRSVRALKLR